MSRWIFKSISIRAYVPIEWPEGDRIKKGVASFHELKRIPSMCFSNYVNGKRINLKIIVIWTERNSIKFFCSLWPWITFISNINCGTPEYLKLSKIQLKRMSFQISNCLLGDAPLETLHWRSCHSIQKQWESVSRSKTFQFEAPFSNKSTH